MKNSMVLLFLLASIATNANANTVEKSSITQCASLLPNNNYNISLGFKVKNGKAEVNELSVADTSSKSIKDVPQQQLIAFTKCIAPLLSVNKNNIKF
ncbi:hypothetical protein [Photobacterium carnosum]|uniref:hypothetical protein n=1 Tax=Photobacterium carnosum TaxID=2023717 RepID=UPI001E5F0807|nr:hypothetical protein [Photobacterium carnosum]MCD9515636.1 hypothetical protein [Photobacterium carnosum]